MGEHRAPEEEIGVGRLRAAFGIPLGSPVIKKIEKLSVLGEEEVRMGSAEDLLELDISGEGEHGIEIDVQDVFFCGKRRGWYY